MKLPRRFSLRLALILVTLLAVAMGRRVGQCNRHERALTQLKERGVVFYRDFENPIGPNWMWTSDGLGGGTLERNGLGWLIGSPLCIVGYHSAMIQDIKLSVDELAMLEDVQGLNSVELYHIPITVDVVKCLLHLDEMDSLFIDTARIDKEATTLLAHLPRLEVVLITSDDLAGSDVDQLSSMLRAGEKRISGRDRP